jgi:hypothetical protein
MTDRSIARPIAIATLICGTLDILLAVILSSIYGKGPATMLRSVASGPFPAATDWGAAGSALGLVTHFVLMAIMVTVFMLAARRIPALTSNPWLWGLVYGLITYVVMNLIVVPVRFGAPLPPSTRAIVTQLFAHIVLVGWPTAFIARRYLR